MIRAAKALASGCFEESEKLSEVARCFGERLHDSSPTHNYMVQTFQRARLRGTFTNLEGAMTVAEERYPDIVGYRAALALLLAKQGNVDPAYRIISSLATNRFSDIAMDGLALWILTMLAEATCIRGEPGWNVLLYDKLKLFDKLNIVMSLGSAFDGAVSHYLGMLAGSRGDWSLPAGISSTPWA